jgi:carbonic anhydrase
MFFDHVGLALALHNITEVWCFDHMDCGMYKATLNLKTDEDHSLHVKKMTELKKLIAAKHPELKFKGFIIEKSGSISPAV